MSKKDEKKTPQDFLRAVFRRRRLFLLSASLLAIAVLLGATYLDVKYTGTTIFERRSDPAAGQTLERGSESFDTIKRTLEHELVGRGAVERVANELGLTRELPHDPEGNLTEEGQMVKQGIVRNLMENIEVDWPVQERSVDLITVSVTHSNQDLAKKIPNALVTNYINRVFKQIKERLTESRDFLLKQVNKCKERVDNATREKIEFETKHAGSMPESPNALHERIQGIIADLDVLRREHNETVLKIVRFTTQLKKLGLSSEALPPTGQSDTQPASQPATQPADQPGTQPASRPVEWVKELNPERKRLEKQLRESEEYLNNALISGMKEKHPTIKTIRAKIADLEKRLEKEPEWITVSQTIARTDMSATERAFAIHVISADLAAAKSEFKTKKSAIERKEVLLAKNEPMMKNFAKIRQSYLLIIDKIKKEQDDMGLWQKRLTEVQMALEAEAVKERTHLTTVQGAQKQLRPSSPKLFMVIAFAIVGGMAFGGGMIFLVGLMDRSVSTTEDAIEHFNLPIHGTISEIVSRQQRVRKWLMRWMISPVMTVIMLVVLLFSGLRLAIWLGYMNSYTGWMSEAVGFVSRNASDLARSVSDLF